MGKRIIIKGADFSANAIEQVLPARYDYKLLEMVENGGFIPSNIESGDYVVYGVDGTLHQYNGSAYQAAIPMAENTVLKVTDNLYAIYKDSDFTILTENDNDVTPGFVPNRVFNYTAPNTVVEGSNNGWRSATVAVQVGDIVILKGKGGGNARLMMVSNTNAMEHVSPQGANVLYTIAYEVKQAGTLYVNMDSSSQTYLKVLR